MIRYALHKPEPLQAETAAFCGAVRGCRVPTSRPSTKALR